MKQIKYEYVHRERVSSFVFGDIRGAKLSMDMTIRSSKEKGINGYIQDIDYTPFGFQLYSEIQVKS